MTLNLSPALLIVAPIFGQWINYPTPGAPRLPNGKINLTAPATRTGGHPDLSGVWELEPAPCRPNGLNACGDDYRGGPEFGNLGVHVPGGLPYQPWAAALVKQRSAELGKDDPVAWCKPSGALRLWTFPPYRKIISTPAVTVLLSERDVTFRQIFTDGRPLPVDPSPSPNGYSVGRWQQDSFVVETIGMREGTWLDRNGSPLGEGAKMTERLRRTNFGTLDVEITMDDPKAYTKPWTVRLHQILVPDTDLLEYNCNDNEKDNVHQVGK